jgi:HK97 gp10 family phage protein
VQGEVIVAKARGKNARNWKVNIEGIEEVASMFIDMSDTCEAILDEATKSAAEIVLKDAKNKVPVDTGKLRDALEISKEKTKKGKVGYQVRSKKLKDGGVKYAYAVEFGHKKKSGTVVAAQPYLRPAIEQNKDKIKDIINEKICEGIDKFR